MRQRGWLMGSLCGIALACALPHAHAESVSVDRIQSVRALIEESTAAKRVQASSHREARARHERARELHALAVQAARSGDRQGAEKLLSQAAQTMFEAVRMLETDASVLNHKQHDFDSRLESVKALSAAHERICEEKKCDQSVRDEVARTLQRKLQEALALKSQGQIDRARVVLDEAYVAVKVAIEHQRSGDTLVRSLQFKSKKEEYAYEVDRNDTHRMLISILLQDKAREAAGATLQRALEAASKLRAQAESQAAAGQYEAAIQALEASTREFQRAIRGAGIYIPG